MPDIVGTTDNLILGLTRATTSRALYPPSHPKVQGTVDEVCEALEAALDARSSHEITLLVVDDELAVDGEPWHRASVHCSRLVRAFERVAIERLTFSAKAGPEEIEGLFAGMVGRGDLDTTENIVLGKILGVGSSGDKSVDGEFLASLEGCMDGVQQAMGVLTLDADGAAKLERSVWQLIEATTREGRAFALLATLRSRDDYLYRHAINVCLHAIHLARAIGIQGEVLQDLGVAALLHDIGLEEMPDELLGRRGQLSDEQRSLLRRHPELGAAKLAGIHGLPQLTVVVAYEHHRYSDGSGGFPDVAGKPNLASQITAVADSWDNLVGMCAPTFSQREKLRFATNGLRRRSGSVLSPFLVESFVTLMEDRQIESLSAAD